MFDTDVLNDEEVFAGKDMAKKEINVAEKDVSTVDLVTTAGEVVTTTGIEVSTASATPVSAATTTTTTGISKVEITLSQALAELQSAKPKVMVQELVQSTTTTAPSTIPKAKSITFREPGESTTRTTPTPIPSNIKDKGKAKMIESERPLKKKEQIRLDEELALKLQVEEEEEDRLAKEKAQQVEEANISWDNDYWLKDSLRAQEKRNKPPTKAQKKSIMSTYLKHMAGYKQSQLKNKSFADIQKLFDKAMTRVNMFVDMDTELFTKKQKVDDDKEKEDLKQCFEIVQDDEVAIDAIPLATKPPMIVDFQIHTKGKQGYYEIIRADGSLKIYLVFSQLLKEFNREYLKILWRLVNAKHGNTRPEEAYERVLWGDLKVMFEPDIESEVWRNLQGHKVTVWKLFDSCRVHFVRFQNLHIYMLVEKKYPLTPATITDMLNKKLQADHWNEMVYQLLKLMAKQQKNQ
ncbi:hypothetical protein Tco_1010197 [Tanacetum coccineum]